MQLKITWEEFKTLAATQLEENMGRIHHPARVVVPADGAFVEKNTGEGETPVSTLPDYIYFDFQSGGSEGSS